MAWGRVGGIGGAQAYGLGILLLFFGTIVLAGGGRTETGQFLGLYLVVVGVGILITNLYQSRRKQNKVQR